jgi:hypothetical protein
MLCINPALETAQCNLPYRHRFIGVASKNGNMVQATNGYHGFYIFLNMRKVAVLIIFMEETLTTMVRTNDLIYIPTTAEISTMNFTGGPAQGVALINSSTKIVI